MWQFGQLPNAVSVLVGGSEREGERGKKIEKMGQTKWSTLLRVSSGASLNGLTEVDKKVP